MSSNQEKIAQVLRDGSLALRKLAAERDTLQSQNEKLAQENKVLHTRMEAEKVAMDMHERNVHTNIPLDLLVEQLEKKAHEDPRGFEVIREAVNMTGPDLLKTASVGSSTSMPDGSSTDFERFILGDVS